MSRNKPDQSIEPYAPNYSAQVGAQTPVVEVTRTRVGCFGCTLGGMVILAISGLLLALIIVGGWLLTVEEATKICLFNCSTQRTEIRVGPIIQALEREAWLETLRSNRQLDMFASNDWPGVLPGRRSLRYRALVTVTAGVDLERITEDSISSDGTTVYINLPPTQIKDCILDEVNSTYYDRNCSALGVVSVGCGGLEAELRAWSLVVASLEGRDELMEDAFTSAAETVRGIVFSVSPDIEQVVITRSTEPIPEIANNGTCVAEMPLTSEGVEIDWTR